MALTLVENSSLYFMGGMYIIAGLIHFWKPKAYLKIMPKWLPYHKELVFLSGFFEVLFGILILFPSTQAIGAWGLIATLIGVFPANIDMLFTKAEKWWVTVLLWLRLPVQFWLIYWAWLFT
jgi:uncharacterized membrane protein